MELESNDMANISMDILDDDIPRHELITAFSVYAIILSAGCIGNSSVIWVICRYRNMRNSVMNIYILNMAFADLTLNLFGLPEVIQFLMNDGWILGLVSCKVFRYAMVTSLYVSILSLLAISIERSAAILYPIKAHTLLTKKRIKIAVVGIWAVSISCALPVAVFNTTHQMANLKLYCITRLPKSAFLTYKYLEFALFFAIPLIVQIILYVLISKRLTKSTLSLKMSQAASAQTSGAEANRLHPRGNGNSQHRGLNRTETWKSGNTAESRKRVIRMLTACVLVYFISYTPAQVLLFYETFSNKPFVYTWFLKSVMYTLGFINASTNPIIYCICSESFRSRFGVMYGCIKEKERKANRLRYMDSTLKSGGSLRTMTTTIRVDPNAEWQPLNRVEEQDEEDEVVERETVR